MKAIYKICFSLQYIYFAHTVSIRFARMTSQKVTVFPSEQSWFPFIMQKRCIFCEVGKEFFVSFRWTSVLNGIRIYIQQENDQISIHEEDYVHLNLALYTS